MYNLFLKKYISCEWLEYGLACIETGINNCCMYHNSDKFFGPVAPIKNGEYDFELFFKYKKQFRKQHRYGKIIERCEGCPFLKEDIWDKSNKIKQMIISSNTRCNADCIYCYTHGNKDYFNNRADISIIKFIKNAIAKKIIDKNTFITIGGGEPTLNKEFDEIINLIKNIDGINIKIYSSGILYSKSIEEMLKLGRCQLVISPDSGDRELYKKIKGVDKFDDVWQNIEKYSRAQIDNKTQVRAKYIIIQNINDKESDIMKFFDKVIETGVHYIKPELDNRYYNLIENNVEELKKVFSLLKFMEKQAEQNNIEHGVAGNFYCALSKHQKLYDDV